MKLGQVLSTVDFDLDPRGRARGVQGAPRRPCATTRRRSPSRTCARSLEQDLGGKLDDHFAEFDEEPIAAASIGQVYRATTHDGARRRGQGPVPGRRRGGRDRPAQHGHAVPALKRLAPGLDAKAIAGRAARAHRRGARLRDRGRRTSATSAAPSAATRSSASPRSTRRCRRAACWSPSSSTARGSTRSSSCPRPSATASPRSPSASSTACSSASASPRATRTRATTCCADDDASASWTSASCATSTRDYLEGERALARAVIDGRRRRVHRWLASSATCPDPDDFEPRARARPAADRRRVVLHDRLPPARPRSTCASRSRSARSPRSQYFD